MLALKQSQMNEASFWRNVWAVNPDYNTTTEDLLKEGYWAHVAHKLKPQDHIEARSEDGSFYGELIVLDVGRTWAKVVFKPGYPLIMEKTEVAEIKVDKDYSAVFKGPRLRWCVIRLKDKEIVKDNLFPKEAAVSWINEHVKALAK